MSEGMEDAPGALETEAQRPKSDWKLPQSDVQFAFGPEMCYWIICGGRWRFISSKHSVWSDLDILNPSWAAFKHNTGYFIGGVSPSGKARVVHTWNDGYSVTASEVDSFVRSRDAYKRLYSWLSNSVEDGIERVNDVFMTVGPSGSYFARCGTKWISHALPHDLETTLREKAEDKDRPRSPAIVTLGMDYTWMVLWSDGSRTWNLRNSYPDLADHAALCSEDGAIVYMALNPYQRNCWFYVNSDGGCNYKFSMSDRTQSQAVNELTNEYMRMRAKRDGTTFNHPYHLDGSTTNVRITPTEYTKEQQNHLIGMWRERRGILVQRQNVVVIGGIASCAGVLSRLTGATTLGALRSAANAGTCAAFGLMLGDYMARH